MLDLSSMRLTFSDEFDTRSISQTGTSTRWSDIRNEWRYDANSDIGFGDTSFLDPASGYDPFNVSNGILTITAVKDRTPSGYHGSWESGLITTQNSFSQLYGYFEIRADFSSKPGSWDAFWLMPTTPAPNPNNYPGWQELDIVEHYGVEDHVIFTHIHTTDPELSANWREDLQIVNELANPTGFHTYGVLWTADTISMYIDGEFRGSRQTPPDMHQAMYLIANLATRPEANATGEPMSMQIDYIRAYALPTATQSPPTFTFGGGGASTAVSTPENRLAVATLTATDPNGDALTFSLAGGADAGRFTIDASSGALAFKALQDFESPADANADGTYDVTVRVSDGTLSATQALRVSLSNVVETQARTLTSGADQFVARSDDHWNVDAGTGDDIVATRGGNDTLKGGRGSDTLTGGGGRDVFQMVRGDGHDTITDFAATGAQSDILAVSGFMIANFGDLVPLMSQAGSDTRIAFENGNSVLLKNVDARQLTAANFQFANVVAKPAGTTSVAGTGPDKLEFKLAQTYFAGGNANFTVTVDGQQVGGVFSASAVMSTGQRDTLTLLGNWGAGTHSVSIRFLNDAYDAATLEDRNLVVFGASFNGSAVNGAAGALYSAGSYAFNFSAVDVSRNAPVFTFGGGGASATVSTPENRLAIANVTATDPDGGVLTFALAGGSDASLFAINASTGALSFKASQNFEAPADANRDAIYEVTVSVSDGALSATQALRVALTNVVETQTRTLTDGHDQFVATSDDHWIVNGGLGDDRLTMRGGDDSLDGGLGADVLTGGAGRDGFYFTTAPGNGNFDKIADFSSADDTIYLDDAIFSAAGRPGALAADAFYAGNAAHDATDRIIYDSVSGNIMYDPDGAGARPALLIAQLAIGTQVVVGDFVIT